MKSHRYIAAITEIIKLEQKLIILLAGYVKKSPEKSHYKKSLKYIYTVLALMASCSVQ